MLGKPLVQYSHTVHEGIFKTLALIKQMEIKFWQYSQVAQGLILIVVETLRHHAHLYVLRTL